MYPFHSIYELKGEPIAIHVMYPYMLQGRAIQVARGGRPALKLA